MKKYLLLLIGFVTTSLFGQFKTTKITTTRFESSKMIWNYQEDEWDFKSNNDITEFTTEWEFNVNSNNKGMISNGNVNYDILDYKYVNETLVMLKLYNVKVGRNMDMLISKKDNKLIISVFDYNTRISYYFY